MTTKTKTMTLETLLTRYADDIAFVTEEAPATNLADLTEQISTAAERLSEAHIQGAEELDTAAAVLQAAETAEAPGRATLLNRAARYLADVTDIVAEYRLMV
ncbi:hypothetical protein [Streptomyces sp. NBC_01789]|uniref:hypothetical protein n=1 Tax=Streptomyces sp. NBC_01789 TaxID=2975941 RepID=UPI00225751FE|nr:hypothetical protein [Streptomyces sp. NBC_01789]MCX4450664.1 hypothetical protein [Streptomyces sp. NBC_01789]